MLWIHVNPDLETWIESSQDPFREGLMALDPADLPDAVMSLAEPLTGDPAFDPQKMDLEAAELILPTGTEFSHPMLERSVRIGLAHIDATFHGDHPKYGVKAYAETQHDSFPPTIVAVVDALTLWGFTDRASELLGYWLQTFVRTDGTVDYYGVSLSEYGQLLTSAKRLLWRGGSDQWLVKHVGKLEKLAAATRLFIHAQGPIGLPIGVPEADESDRDATYFHNAAWLARGLFDWADLLEYRLGQGSRADAFRQEARELQNLLLSTIETIWPSDPEDWWLRPMVERESEGYFEAPEGRVTANRLGSYTNYRYWPELLSSNMLPRHWNERIVESRINAGGQFVGITRFEGHLDDWPLMDHMDGLRNLGRTFDYNLCLWGHIAYHQAEGHLTAYEQVSFPPGKEVCVYCLPCQLVAARAAAPRTDSL